MSPAWLESGANFTVFPTSIMSNQEAGSSVIPPPRSMISGETHVAILLMADERLFAQLLMSMSFSVRALALAVSIYVDAILIQ